MKFTRQLWDFLVTVPGLDGDHGKSGTTADIWGGHRCHWEVLRRGSSVQVS